MYLILLVLRDKVVHITLGFGKFHLVHPFASVPLRQNDYAQCRGVARK